MTRLTSTDRLAQHMANGRPSIREAARLMGVTTQHAERLWRSICRTLGAQAR